MSDVSSKPASANSRSRLRNKWSYMQTGTAMQNKRDQMEDVQRHASSLVAKAARRNRLYPKTHLSGNESFDVTRRFVVEGSRCVHDGKSSSVCMVGARTSTGRHAHWQPGERERQWKTRPPRRVGPGWSVAENGNPWAARKPRRNQAPRLD